MEKTQKVTTISLETIILRRKITTNTHHTKQMCNMTELAFTYLVALVVIREICDNKENVHNKMECM